MKKLNAFSKWQSPVFEEKKPLFKRIKKKAKQILGVKRRIPYQTERNEGTDKRWEIISDNLKPGDRSILDLGCNLGVLTHRAAESGLLAIGIDVDNSIIQKDRSRYRKIPNLSFLCIDLNPDTIKFLPEFDVILCLSVHHYWARYYGLDKSWEMMATLLSKTRNRLFFEPAGQKKKYGQNAPDIIDLDRNSLIQYSTRCLNAVVTKGQSVRHLGETPCIGREPFRLIFLVER